MFTLLISFLLLFHNESNNLVEARCGYPELPYMAEITSGQFENWGFFEEGQQVKVICEKKHLIGHLKERRDSLINLNSFLSLSNFSTTITNASSLMSIYSSIWIQCQNSRWNTTGLSCIEKVDIDSPKIHIKWQNIQKVHDATPLIDRNAESCLDIDLDLATSKKEAPLQEESILFTIPLDSSYNNIPRVVLLVKNTENSNSSILHQVGTKFTMANELEDLITELNQSVNQSAININESETMKNGDGNVAVEEEKQFLDFVYESEFQNHSIPMKIKLLDDDDDVNSKSSESKYKIIRTLNYEIKFSILISAAGNNGDQLSTKECYFNEDAAIATATSHASSTSTVTATELLIFDCYLPNDDGEQLSTSSAMSARDYNNQSNSNSNHSSEQQKQYTSHYIWIRLEIIKLNNLNQTELINITTIKNNNITEDNNQQPQKQEASRSLIHLCGLEVFSVINHGGTCGKPYLPIYGWATKSKMADKIIAQYGCVSGYRAINLTKNLENQLDIVDTTPRVAKQIPMVRTCDPMTGRWHPQEDDIFCVPVNSCRSAPPLPDAKKFYFEYTKLDNLKRAIAGISMATLRCIMLTDYVMPYTIYGCDKSGRWVRLSKNDTEPQCRTSLNRTFSGGRRGTRPNHYYHHYYHYYKDTEPQNRTAVIIFGRQITDNKYIIYYGVAGLVILFGGSFIILFHVRRMAKKISRQMREHAYQSDGRGLSDSFLPMNIMDSEMPPYYNDGDYDYCGGNEYSNDLPPPTTPISLPTADYKKKERNNLASNFDSIKF